MGYRTFDRRRTTGEMTIDIESSGASMDENRREENERTRLLSVIL